MSLLLKALKQVEHSPIKAASDNADLDLEPMMDTPFSVRRDWVQPHDNDTEPLAQSRHSKAQINWPLGLVPTTALLALLIAVGYGIYIYLVLNQPAPIARSQTAMALPSIKSPHPNLPSASIAPKPQVATPTEEHKTASFTTQRVRSRPSGAIVTHAARFSSPVSNAVPAPSSPQWVPTVRRNDPQAELEAAYQAYQAGRLDEAKDLYNNIPDRDKNTDALLGLAAIAVVQGHQADGVRLYQHVMRLDPRNAVAQAALLDTLGTTDNTAAESRLKNQIQQAPSAYLYYALGNLHADQKRWSDAEAAYYEAYKRDPSNGDYAFNLAVSLDHLQQNDAAIRQYRTAISLAGPESQFSRDQAEARIQQLKGR
jgi:Tfp pilus assembly protein PilF